MRTLRWIDKQFARTESFMLVLLLCMLICLAFLQVVLRNFFNSGIIWLDQFLRHLVLWVVFFGAAQATRLKKHLSIDALSRILSDSQKRFSSLIINAFSLFVVILLARGAWNYLLTQYKAGTLLFLGIERWVFQIIIPLGLILIGYRFFLHLIETIIDIVRGTES